MSELVLGLRNLRRDYMWTNIRAIVLRDHEDIVLPGTTIQLRRGTEIVAPRWLVRMLSERKILEPREEPMKINELGRYSFLETRSRQQSALLQKLPTDFYQKLRDYLETIRRKLSESPSPEIIDEYRRARSYTYDILRVRLQRILSLVQAGEESSEIREQLARLTPEELILYKTIRRLIEDWQKEVTGLEEVLI